MRKGRRAQAPKPKRGMLIAAALALVAVVGAAAFALLRDGPAGDGSREYVPVARFGDVHGLAVDAEDPRNLYVATHHGLVRGVDGAGWARVGAMQDDLMGFSMHPTNGSIFWTSGHPVGGGNMGVRQSTDGGFTWTTLWDRRVDFHAMTASRADPRTLWGYWSGDVHRSLDGGATWAVVAAEPPAIRALASSPESALVVLAATSTGIAKSDDGGATWSSMATLPALGLAVDPTDARVVYAAGQNALWRSADGGREWARLDAAPRDAHAFVAVDPKDPRVVYTAAYSGSIYRSADAGTTWTTLRLGDVT